MRSSEQKSEKPVTVILIDQYGMTYAEVAAAIGCSEMTVRRWYDDTESERRALPVYRRGLARLLTEKEKKRLQGRPRTWD